MLPAQNTAADTKMCMQFPQSREQARKLRISRVKVPASILLTDNHLLLVKRLDGSLRKRARSTVSSIQNSGRRLVIQDYPTLCRPHCWVAKHVMCEIEIAAFLEWKGLSLHLLHPSGLPSGIFQEAFKNSKLWHTIKMHHWAIN